MSTFLQRFRSSSYKGFTLIELLIVIAIVTILTGIFLFQQRQFDSSTLLRSLAYRTALTIREAQTYGTSVRFAGGVTSAPASAYGIVVQAPVGFPATPITSYILFADINNDRTYDSGEEIEVFTLGSKYTISRFRAHISTVTTHTSGVEINSLTILFIRPNPDGCFATSVDATACVSPPSTYTSADIQLSAPGGTTRSVTITNTGQISVGAVGS